LISIVTGFAAGLLHVFVGVDHLAALAPIAVRDPTQATLTGAKWGLGHGLGVVIIGGLGLAFRSVIDIDAVSAWAEFVVGFMLIAIGIWAILKSRRVDVHQHSHAHEASAHDHLHAHESDDTTHRHAALGVGLLHGMAGSGHLFGVLPALALPTGQAVLYLLAYLVAAVGGMAGFGFFIGRISRSGGPERVTRLMAGSGVVAIVVGLFWLFL
jgi:hypothetical protein